MGLDLFDQRQKPIRNPLGRLQPLQRVIVTEPERSHPALAFEGAELKWLQRQRRDVVDELALKRRRDELRDVTKSLRQRFLRSVLLRKKRELLGQADVPGDVGMNSIWDRSA